MTEAGGKDENSPFTAPLAKLSLPRLARGVVRPRLFTVLDKARLHAATWIASPAGAGKTTLVATWLLEYGSPYLWYQLDEDDVDPATFFYYLGIAAKHASPDKALFLPLLTPEYLPDIPGFARRYFRKLFTLLPSGTVLVLDNYQEVDDAAIFSDILRSAIGEIPEGGHLLVISRADPPPALARHRATGALNLLDWDTLRLTLDETQSIAVCGSPLDDKSIRTLHERADGWPAAVTLMLEHIKRNGAENWDIRSGSLETVFHFFANEFFNALPETTQDFLLMTALFSHITPTLAEQLSGNPDAGSILTDLHRRHFFTHLRVLEETSYQYHALFREFLLVRAAETYTRDQYLALTSRAGRLLNERHHSEEAVILYLRVQDWQTAIPLLLSQAPLLLAQGRAQILIGWLQQIPEKLIVSTPWLLYWKGMSQMSVQPFDALDTLRKAYSGFDAINDAMGRIITASAIIDIIYFLRLSLLSATPWLDILQKELALNPPFPTSAMEGRVLTSLLSALMYMRPQDMRLFNYARRLSSLLDSNLDVNHKVLMGAHLVHYYATVEGDLQACECTSSYIKPLLTSPHLTALSQFIWRALSTPFFIIAHRPSEALDTTQPLLDLVKDNNLTFMEYLANLYVFVTHFSLDETANAATYYERFETLINFSHPADIAWLYLGKALFKLREYQYESALYCAKNALRLTNEVGATLIILDIHCLMAIASCELNNFEESHDYLIFPKSVNYGNSPRVRSQVHQIEAYIYLKQGTLSKCHDSLREAFSIASKYGYFGSWLCWNPCIATRLCAEALRTGIEMEYVRQLIRKRKLLPEDSTIEHWPWPVRIYTLGQFKVMLNDQEIPELKAQRKPFTLLQSLIALGGAEVKIDRITEIVWPDAEGDAAVSAFTTTVSRLRKLIGEHVIIVKGGRMSLNERYCWVDVRALERQLDLTDNPEGNSARDCAEKLLALYRGAFLSDEDGEWIQRRRRRLREKFSRRFTKCINALLTVKKNETAERLLERAMDTDADFGHLFKQSFPVLTPAS